LLAKQLKELSSITVKVHFKKLKDNPSKQHELCEKTFAFVGLKDVIYVK
jgi:hypothetical protein